jgi:hypothetical protein
METDRNLLAGNYAIIGITEFKRTNRMWSRNGCEIG